MPLSRFSLHRLSPSTFDQFSLPRSNFSSSTSFSFLPSLSLSPSILSPSSCWGCDQSAALFSCTNTTTLQLGASLPLLLLLFLLRTRKCFWLLRDTKFDNNEQAFQLASRRSLSKKESVDLRGSLIDFQGFIESNNHFRANMWSRADF